jgi:hypothetical protein
MGRFALTDAVEQLPQVSSVRTSSISGIITRSGHKGFRDKIFSLEIFSELFRPKAMAFSAQ